MKLKKDPLKFQKIQNSYKEYSNKKKLENRPPPKVGNLGAEGPQQGPKGPGGPKGPQPSAGGRRRAAVGRPNLLVLLKVKSMFKP